MKSIKKECLNCGKTFDALVKELNRGRAVFCSRSCSNSFSKKGKVVTAVEIICSTCGKRFNRAPSKMLNSKSGYFFCSRNCKEKAQRVGIDCIKEIQPDHYGTGKSRYRDRAIREYGAICNKCGYDEFESLLEVHHIDFNHDNGEIENLQVLCKMCHGRIHVIERRTISGQI